MANVVETIAMPCQGDLRFLQPGEDVAWGSRPETRAAVTICHTECPTSRLVDCARRALESGSVSDESERVTRPADGVVAAGIVCSGDDATATALRGLIARYGRETGAPPTCLGCRRRFVPAREPLSEDTAHRAARGLCSGCYSATGRAGRLARVHQIRPTACVDCAKPLVGRHDPVPDGHARHHSHGRCTTCQTRHRRNARKAA